MGGKTSKSTQTVSIPPEVLARYNAVNARAEEVAGRPFQPYSYNPADFAAQLTPSQLAGIQNVNYAAGQAQPYFDEATGQLMGAQMAAVPYYGQAGQDIAAGQYMGQRGTGMAENLMYQGLSAAQPFNYAASGAYQQGYQQGQELLGRGVNEYYGALATARPYADAATQQYYAGLQRAEPLQQYALQTLGRAGMTGEALSGQALASLIRAGMVAQPLQQLAQGIYGEAYQGAQPYNVAALQQYYGGLGAAGPLSQQALQNVAAAQVGAQPYQQFATELGLAAARPVTPGPLTGFQIGQYMSPYMSTVVGQTQALLNQQAQQAQAEQTGAAIRAGAFGGDRARIAAANLAQQQQLAQGKVLGDLLQSGYGQALATAQQQQQINLAAEQANRAAQQAAAGQLLGVGQTGFGQGITAAQQQAALAQQLFGQQLAAGQGIAGLGQQAFGQGLAAGQAQQNLAQQLFGQGATTAQQQAAIAQALFGQGATSAAQQAALAQQQFGQNVAAAQGLAGLGQQLYAQQFGLGQGLTSAGQQAFQQGTAFGEAQRNLAQQLYAQGLGASQQQAALGQQGFAQQLAAAQAEQALGQGLYGMGAGTAQQLAALGTGAQGAALQGAQAQLAAGQAQQQTAQAGLQALYNQFLQQQAYPFQVAQFLGNIAMGTGALSGSTTQTVQPGSIFSDIRTKENVREVGKTLDGQPIYSFNYKGDPKTQMGLIAQEVEERHPEAVGLAGGLKTVNYKKATRDAERRGEILDAEFSPISEGGSVTPSRAGLGFADGGVPGVADEARKAEEEMRRRQEEQAAQNEQRAAQAAIQTAKQQAPAAKQAPAPQVDLKPNLSVKPEVGGAAPAKIDIPTTPPSIPQLAVAGPAPAADQGSKDAQAIAALIMAFSDRRMKEDVKHIGFTHDGQKIYSYRIKGEPHTQIGLMADEVQEHKPEAVGSMNGLKMVDYDRATEDAIRKSRGGYADGGSPYAGLVSPTDMAALLAAQAQMFGPLSQFGRQITGTPGAPGYVPGATLPVGSLMTAGNLPAQRSTADDIESALKIGEGIKKIREPKAPPTPTPSTTETEVPGAVEGRTIEDFHEDFEQNRYRGGSAYADGGQVIPYATPTALSIPVEMKTPELMKAGSLPKQRSTMDDIAQALGIASDIKNLIPKTYGGALGRHGYQTDGRVGATGSWEDERDVMQRIRDAVGAPKPITGFEPIDRVLRQAIAAQSGATTPTPPAPPAATPPSRPAELRPASDRRVVDTRVPAGGTAPPVDTAAPAVVPPGPPAAAPAAVPAGGLAGPAAAQPPVAAAPPAPAGGLQPPAAPAAATSEQPKKTGILDWLRKEENYIPLLRGAAAAAAAPTQYTLPALLVGAGAYGKAKGDIMQQLAETEQTKASTQQTRAQTMVGLANVPQQAIITDNQGRTLGVRVFGPNNEVEIIPAGEFFRRQNAGERFRYAPSMEGVLPQTPLGAPPAVPGAPATAGTPAPAVTPAASGAVDRSAVRGQLPIYEVIPADMSQGVIDRANDVQSTGVPLLSSQPENNPFTSQSVAATAQRQSRQQRNILAKAFADLPPEQSGVFASEIANPVFNWVSSTLTFLGVSPEFLAQYVRDPKDLANQQVVNKITTQLAQSMQAEGGGVALGKFMQLLEAIPRLYNTKEGQAELVASMYTQAQRELDLDRFYNLYRDRLQKEGGLNAAQSGYAGRGLEAEFSRRQDPIYNVEKNVISKMFTDTVTLPDGKQVPLLSYLVSQGGNVPAGLQRLIKDKYSTRDYDASQIIRYFGGG